MSNKLHYIVADYYATGEGRTISILITQPQFVKDDYEIEPHFTQSDDDVGYKYNPGVLKPGHTEKVAVYRQFVEEFDGFYALGAENLDRGEFLNKFGKFVPEVVLKMTDSNDSDPLPAFHYKAQLYFNYS